MLQLTSSCCAWLLWACICSLNLAERRPQSISKPFLRLKMAIPVSFLQIRTTRTPHSRADEVVCSKKQKNMDTWTNNTCSCQQYVDRLLCSPIWCRFKEPRIFFFWVVEWSMGRKEGGSWWVLSSTEEGYLYIFICGKSWQFVVFPDLMSIQRAIGYFSFGWWKGRWDVRGVAQNVRGVAHDEFWSHQRKDYLYNFWISKSKIHIYQVRTINALFMNQLFYTQHWSLASIPPPKKPSFSLNVIFVWNYLKYSTY